LVTTSRPSGVIAAVATAIDSSGGPDAARSTALGRFLLAHGCDGLNVLGTTGEATSFSLEQRRGLMTAYADAGLPMHRLLVGTGAAALADAVALTRHAAELGFAGALLLPPFYYRDVPDTGLLRVLDAIIEATASRPIPIYLYHFPALSGVPWHLGLIARLIATFKDRVVGLKDSSGDLDFARAAAALGEGFDVFPSSEAVLGEARRVGFAGCISATVNLNADLCARAYWQADPAALAAAAAVRALFAGKPVVPGVKSVLAHIHAEPAWAQVMPPLEPASPADATEAAAGYAAVRARLAA
jgi:4-hydroxy-tetrahydrodipicolinate synthase